MAARGIFPGLFLLSAGTLLLELALRIFRDLGNTQECTLAAFPQPQRRRLKRDTA